MAKNGDLAALDRMSRCYGERLMAMGRRYCRSEEEARDAVQDTWLAAREHLADFRGDGSLEGWLVRMVANACQHMRRGRKNDPSLHQRDLELRAQDHSPEGLAARGELAQALGQALLTLEARDRTILLLAEAEGWTGPQIAEAMGTTPGAVRTRLTRARARLKAQLEPLEPAGESL